MGYFWMIGSSGSTGDNAVKRSSLKEQPSLNTLKQTKFWLSQYFFWWPYQNYGLVTIFSKNYKFLHMFLSCALKKKFDRNVFKWSEGKIHDH